MDQDNLGMSSILPVANDDESFEIQLPPANGMDYLRRVRHEARECPSTVTVSDVPIKQNKIVKPFIERGTAQSLVYHRIPALSPSPCGYSPNAEWQRNQVSSFSRLRMNLAKNIKQMKSDSNLKKTKLPAADNVDGWCKLCFGQFTTDNDAAAGAADREALKGCPPLLSIIYLLDQTTLLAVLEYHINWFAATGFTEHQGAWFYALLALLEKPLLPEACSLIRQLARQCSNLRASLESPTNELLPQLNLLICIVSRYFDQTDLADELTPT